MKIVAFSDSHGNRSILRDAAFTALQRGPIDICVHCGDGARDMDAIEPILLDANPNTQIYAARGNCDFGAFSLPYMETFEANGVRMLVTHGHTYDVKTHYAGLTSVAESLHAKVAFFGHTHRPMLEAVHGIYLINPGAICAYMPGNVAYAQVIVAPDGKIRADLMSWLS